jgi:hypothetical protein
MKKSHQRRCRPVTDLISISISAKRYPKFFQIRQGCSERVDTLPAGTRVSLGELKALELQISTGGN